MRRKWNRFVAGLLSIIMLVTMLPMEVLAAGNGGKAEQPSQTMPFQDVKSSDWCAKAEIGRASVGKECRSRWSPYH